MKLTSIFLLAVCLQAYARGYGQNTITLSAKNTPLVKVLKEVKKQTGYTLFYKDQLLQMSKPVDVELKDVPLEAALLQIFKNQPLIYEIIGNKIITVKEKEDPEKNSQENIHLAPPIDVHGRVVNEKGEPVVATVTVKGIKMGVSTNNDGEFTIKDVDPNATLVISGIGIETFEVKVNGKANLATLTVKIIVSELDGVLIQAYGTTSQRLNTGNINKVSAEVIEKQPVSNPLAALSGRVPGLIVQQTSGLPGAAISVQIRGQNSLAQGSQPLFIIDGVPFAPGNGYLNQLGSVISSGLSPFSMLNPSDIESIEVLKDADATAIYGSRGANGVILITTKKGEVGKTKFTARVYSGLSRVTRTMDMMNTRQYVAMRKEALANDGVTPTVADAPDLLVWDTTRYADMKSRLIGGSANTTNIQASATGGGQNTQFLITGGYNHETTIFPGDMEDNKGSVLLNVNHVSDDKRFSAVVSAFYSNDKNNLVGAGINNAYRLPPNLPALYDADGKLNWSEGGLAFENPFAYLLQKYKAESSNLVGNLQLNYRILPGLSIKSNAGYNTTRTNENRIIPIASINPYTSVNPTGLSDFADMSFKSWIVEPQMEYERKISKGKINILAGATWQEVLQNSNTIQATGYTSDALLYSISGASNFTASNGYSQYRYEAFFGRINYNWDSRYLINLNGRRDGSSRFGKDRQFANFGSIGAAWIFSNEALIKRIFPFLSYGKIRGSYGITGNDQIGNYQYLDSWGAYPSPYNGTATLYPARLYNADYSWETNKKLECAIELGFLKDRILFSASYYQNRSGNQLIYYALPSQTGFYGITKNFDALIQNKGFEFILTTKNISSKQFNWSTVANLSLQRNKLLSFPGIETSSYSNVYKVGKSLSVINRYHYTGVNQATGVFEYTDVNGDGFFDNNDYMENGNTDPSFYGGLTNHFGYKGFDIDVFVEFRKQKGRNYLYTLAVGGIPGEMVNQPVIAWQRWQKPGDQAEIPQFTATPGTDAYTAWSLFGQSDGIYSDASFIRLKNVSLSYTLPGSVMEKLHVEDARIYILGQNLETITNYKGSDPETQNLIAIPPLRTFAAGIQITL